jgi:site-specific DNA recombinase
MRCGIYARVSTDTQRERQTIASQLHLLPAYASQQGWPVVGQYIDDGISGETIEDRPEFVRLLADIERGLIDVVLVIDFDRLTRSKSELTRARIWDHLAVNRCKLATPSKGLIDLANDTDALTMGIVGGVSAYEKKQILKRTQRGKRDVARRGEYHCSVDPYGYQWDKVARRYILNTVEAAAVKRAYALALEAGCTMTGWRLGQEGHKPRKGGSWGLTSVARMLRNPLYKGAYVMFKRDLEPITVTVPTIIEPAQWQRVQDALSRRLPDAKTKRDREYLIAGLARCGVCGRRIWASPDSRSAKKTYAYYRCHTSNQWRILGLEKHCGNRNFRVKDVDAAVWEKIEQALRDPALLANACALAEPKGVDWVAQGAAADRLLVRLTKVETDLLARSRRGLVSDDALEHELREIGRERDLARKNLKLANQQQSSADAKQHLVKELTDRARQLTVRLHDASFETRRAIVRLVVPVEYGAHLLLNPDGTIVIEGAMAFADQVIEMRLATAV